MTTVYLVRHAEAEGNVYRRLQGWYNSLITDNGYRQIEALARRFENVHIDAVYSSDLFRTMTTASAIYKPKGLTLHTDPDLREVHGGVWEDKPWGLIRREEKDCLDSFNAASLDWQVEGSDTFAGLTERVCAAIRRIAASHEGQTVAIFSHGTAIRAALTVFAGMPLDEIRLTPHGDNTCVACLEFDGDRVEIKYINDNSHLGELSTLGKQTWWKKGGSADYGKMNLWYRPLDFGAEADFYCEARREAWMHIHGTLEGLDGDGFLADAVAQSSHDPRSVMVAMQEERPVGILQMDLIHENEQGRGDIPFFYMIPDLRCQGFGIQLIGQAVSTYRPLGREYLRLRCAPANEVAHRFYERYGFRVVGEEAGAFGPLDVMEKYIGYNEG